MSVAPDQAPSDVDAIVTRAGPALRDRLTRVEARLAMVSRAWSGPLAAHAAATIAAGGKRLRPLLVLLAGEAAAADGGEEALVRAATAVELVHSASLVHDDVLDSAALRRGQVTVAAAAGREVAVATGDLLFSRAFAELARNGSADQLRALSDASSALVAGELLQREDAYRSDVTVERYLLRCELKTGRLFEAACRLGVLAAGGDVELADAIGAYGGRIGLAFQILDDVLDVTGPAERTGKQPGTDLLDGTVTLPLILAREADEGLAELDLATVAGPAQAAQLCARIAATAALEDSRRRALSLVEEARSGLPERVGARERELLELVAVGVVQRYS
jgi:geranylgeranyl pyrophosphate synthase